jgi:2-polyprenyl-3-methyl-5-hydroxy-6-metoxy-1,4-benzoquinol methylase
MSKVLARGRNLFEANQKDPDLPLSLLDKLRITLFLLLTDYADGSFPPEHQDRLKTYEAEVQYLANVPSRSMAQMLNSEIRKPYWNANCWKKYGAAFGRLWRHFEEADIKPGQRLLELGCGTGWMSEALALAGYNVVGTSIADKEIELAQRRVAAIRAKGIASELTFIVSPMESVDQKLGETGKFDAVFVFEALHHAFSWRESFRSTQRCLRPGGWFFIANEPNRFHTLRSYRVGRLMGTHEIGLSRKEMVMELYACGFKRVRVLSPTLDDWWHPHWIAAQNKT